MGISISRIKKTESEKQVEKWSGELDRLWRVGKGKSDRGIELEILLGNYWKGAMDWDKEELEELNIKVA